MPHKFFRRLSSNTDTLRANKYLAPIAHLIDDPNLLHLNRHSVARAVAIGLGVAVLPIFGHILLAGLLAVWRKANIGISILLTWVANPVTIPFILFLEYRLGLLILQRPGRVIDAEWTWAWISAKLGQIWLPMLVGGLALSIMTAFVSYYFVYLVWHQVVKTRWKRRRAKREQPDENKASS